MDLGHDNVSLRLCVSAPRPWHTIGADLFHVNGQWYVLVTDYYSKFPFIRRLSSLKTQAVKAAMMGIFSEHGIPEKLICDNGSQLVSQEYQNFASSLGMTLETSSPEYPRGHGLVERHVQTVKKLIIKCIHSGSDIAMSMLILRSTPLSHTLASPAELLTGRKFRTDQPTRIRPSWTYTSSRTDQYGRISGGRALIWEGHPTAATMLRLVYVYKAWQG